MPCACSRYARRTRVLKSLAVSLLPFPIVRGASPSSTGFLLDGTRVPLLYHLLSGPSVIHPDFIDEVQFYPGGAPVGPRSSAMPAW